MISPKLVEVGRHININLFTNTTLEAVSGECGRFQVTLRRRPRYIDADKCTACGDCAKACPISLPDEYNLGLIARKAVYKKYAQAIPGAFAITKLDPSPCSLTCPAGVNAHGYVSLLGQGRVKEALGLILEALPLPGTLGRICAHPCETECRRGQVDQPVSICRLKRFAADQFDLAGLEIPLPEQRPEKVAIVGSGPAGLSAAYHLLRRGYRPTIFEALPVPGGMLRVGLPAYRLPPEVLGREIGFLEGLGIEIRCHAALGRDFTLDDLFHQGYRAVFLGLGAHGSRKLGVAGEEAKGVIPVTDFLRRVNLGPPPAPGLRTVVIGGGNVAVDAARCARRLGAAEVTLVALENEAEMPAWPWEVEEAREEGIEVMHRQGPHRFLVSGGRVAGVELKAVTRVFDEEGRFAPAYDERRLSILEADGVIVAIGQTPSTGGLKEAEGLALGRGGVLRADPVTLATSRAGVFAGGDVMTGPRLAVDAVAAGREAAESIDRYLTGRDLSTGRRTVGVRGGENWREIPADLEKRPRTAARKLPAAKRVNSFAEIEVGLTPEEAEREAARCLACGVCCRCYQCVPACQAGAVTLETHGQREETLTLEVGSLILAPGFRTFDPSRIPTYNYQTSPNVVTSLEFERLLSATGPYQGRLVRPSDQTEPRKIAFIQCVGSRDIHHADHPY
ncbi:MAG: FAD-dependent oxidoreductase, partial [Thermodesulfobacteriota bacterium]